MSTYADRFAAAMVPLLPDGVAVENAQGLIVIERGSARAMLRPLPGDRRRSVSLTEARAGLADAAIRLSREIPKYRDSFKAPAHELVAILFAASGS